MMEVYTRAEAEKKTYGNQGSLTFDAGHCVEAVYSGSNWWPYQCQRKPVAGPDNLYCKQHDPAAVKRRGDERSARYDREWAAKQRQWRLEAQRGEAATILVDVAKWIAANHKLIESDEWLFSIAEDIAANEYIQMRLEASK